MSVTVVAVSLNLNKDKRQLFSKDVDSLVALLKMLKHGTPRSRVSCLDRLFCDSTGFLLKLFCAVFVVDYRQSGCSNGGDGVDAWGIC